MPLIISENKIEFDKYNSILLVGRIGSGKSYLVHECIEKLKSIYVPDEVKFALFDLKAVEFDQDEIGRDYLLFDIQVGGEQGLEKLDELSAIVKERANNHISKPMILICIEECDLACANQVRFDNAVIAINRNAKAANAKLIYSTSSPRPDTVSADLEKSFEAVIAGNLDNELTKYLGIPSTENLEKYEFVVIEKNG